MRALLLLGIFLFGQSALANRNPQMRTCRIHLAQFWSMKITEPKNDHIGFCKYNNSLIDSISFMKYAYENHLTGSFKAYFDSKAQNFTSCKSAGAKQIVANEYSGEKELLCVFNDYSFIKKSTLLDGWNSPKNSALTEALKNI